MHLMFVVLVALSVPVYPTFSSHWSHLLQPRGINNEILSQLNKILNSKSTSIIPENLKDKNHGIKMGVSSTLCDNAEDNIEVDWDGSAVDYTCFHPKNLYPVNENITEVKECERLPDNYYPKHFCMNMKISYNTSMPTHGDHRPLWPIFGEYKYVPPQRWLHNIEHGAIVMLYHPCAHIFVVNQLKSLVKDCIRKHIITACTSCLSPERPLALVAWGCRLLMNHVNPSTVVSFIKNHALHGPEGKYSKEGQYKYMLLSKADIPAGSDWNDAILCPRFPSSQSRIADIDIATDQKWFHQRSV